MNFLKNLPNILVKNVSNLIIRHSLKRNSAEKRILPLIMSLIISISALNAQDFVDVSKGASIQSLRNDDKSGIIISGCDDDLLKMDDINNLHGDNWTFYFVGTVSGISDIKVKPICNATRMSLQEGCGYVARHSGGSRSDVYVRIFVSNMIHNKMNEVIGADILYESPFESVNELSRKIFWNNVSVPNSDFRKLVLTVFDINNDGKISEAEAGQKKELKIRKGIYDIDGINCLRGITSLELEEGYEGENLTLILPNLHVFSIKEAMSYVKIIDLSGCPNLDTVRIGHLDGTDQVVMKNCTKLKYLDFNSSSAYYTRIYKLLDISGCTALDKIGSANIAMGQKFDASGCISLKNTPWVFEELDLSGCISLNDFYSYYGNSKINFSGCTNIETIYLTNASMAELDLTDLKGLERLNCSGGKISKINFSGCTGLEELTIHKTKLTDLDLSACNNLSEISVDSTAIKNINLTNFKKLNTIHYSWNATGSITISGCTNLGNLFCNYNPRLQYLNLVDCRSLIQLVCNDNALTSLDLSNCDSLQYLYCSDNPQLLYLDLSNNKELSAINCHNTAIQELDISHSITDEWIGAEGYEFPIVLPGAKSGFKTLWVNKNQKIERQDGNGLILLSDKKIDKMIFMPKRDNNGNLIQPASGDSDFKIKIREL
jgi:hypothetical protein